MTLADHDIQTRAYLVIYQPDICIPSNKFNFIRNTNYDTNKNMISVHIKLFTGITMTVSLLPHEKVRDLKYRIHDYFGIHFNQQKLFYEDKELCHPHRLSTYGVQNNSTIYAISSGIYSDKILSFPVTDEQITKTFDDPEDTLRRTMHEVHEISNDVSIQAKRDALLELKNNFSGFWHMCKPALEYHAAICVDVYISLLRCIKDCDEQMKLLEEVKY